MPETTTNINHVSIFITNYPAMFLKLNTMDEILQMTNKYKSNIPFLRKYLGDIKYHSALSDAKNYLLQASKDLDEPDFRVIAYHRMEWLNDNKPNCYSRQDVIIDNYIFGLAGIELYEEFNN